MEIPTIQDKELSLRADAFAEDLATRLGEFNKQNPKPEMSLEAWQYLEKQHGDNIPGLTPDEMIPFFKMIFCVYMGSHYGLVPE